MTIEITFNALNLADLMQQLRAFTGAPVSASAEEKAREDFVRSYEAKEVKRRGRPPKVAPEVSLVEEETVETPPIEAVSEEEADEVSQTEAPPSDAIANEKIKQEVIAQLSDLFTAGKVKTLRHILDTYGRGAKSFPEIDASAFPAIKEALSRGEAA